MVKDKELRSFSVELRVEESDGKTYFVGTPIVYGKRSRWLGFYEEIKPGAATDALKRSSALLLYGHDDRTQFPIAKLGKTMEAFEDDIGVHIRAESPETDRAKELEVHIRRGDIEDMSFAFTVAQGGDSWSVRDGKDYRTITKFDEIYDFSYVATGAYGDTSAAMRSLKRSKSIVIDGDSSVIAAENEDIDIELLLNRYER